MATDASYESDTASISPQREAPQDVDVGAPQDEDEDGCDPRLALPQQKQRGKKRQWVSDTFQSLMESVGGGGESGAGCDEAQVSTSARAISKAKAAQGGNRETTQELERLLGEVSSYEGRLDNLLDFSSSIPDNIDGDGEDTRKIILILRVEYCIGLYLGGRTVFMCWFLVISFRC